MYLVPKGIGDNYYDLMANEDTGNLKTKAFVHKPSQKEVDDHKIAHLPYRK